MISSAVGGALGLPDGDAEGVAVGAAEGVSECSRVG